MASAGPNDFKFPKAPRRPKTPDARQVHFEPQANLKNQDNNITGYTTANSPSGGFNVNNNNNNTKATPKTPPPPPPAVTASEGNQPTNFPALGITSNSQLQWHTSANPTQSLRHQLPHGFISPPPQQTAYFSLPQQQNHPQFHPASFISAPAGPPNNNSTITYIGIGPQQPPSGNIIMGDYQNAAPPPNGVHFQPPVPDTTFGPIPHVYVPRFDGGLAGVQQPVVGSMAPQPGVHASYVVQQQPYYVQQPTMGQQPVFMSGPQQHFLPQAQHVAGGVPAVGLAGGAAVPGTVPIFAGNSGHIPDVSGLGRTAGEEQLRQIQFAHENKLYEPQDFKPADDDPSRFYYVREVDGNWTQRNRFTIDHMGDCRWYVTDEGWFYAVRLPS